MSRKSISAIVLLLFLFMLSQVPQSFAADNRPYLNNTGSSVLGAGAYANITLTQNLTFSQRINHTFLYNITNGANSDLDIQYQSLLNQSGHLIRFRIENQAATANDRITQPLCNDTSAAAFSANVRCTAGCGGNNFGALNTYRVEFNSTSLTGYLFINNVLRATLTSCSNYGSINHLSFFNVGANPENVSNNLLFANNLPPIFIGNLSNLTWNEESSIGFNISANYSDPNNDRLEYNYSLLFGTLNISIFSDNESGTINITPPQNYFGSTILQFYGFDGDNATVSNTINLTVLNVNDLPNITSVQVQSVDDANRSNGTLLALWSYSDIEDNAQQGNETVWYLNGTRAVSFDNLTSLPSLSLLKTQNWTFSVRAFDGSNFSAFKNSTPILLLNSPPTHSLPLIQSSDDQNRKNTTLICLNQTTFDEDNESVTNLMEWYSNGQKIQSASNSVNLTSGNFTKNDNLTCEIAPNDQETNGTRRNSSVFSIRNAAPLQITQVTDKSFQQDSQSSFNLSAHFLDIDSDNLTFNYTSLASIVISINNLSGIATITSDSSYSGSQSVTFFASDGVNTTGSNTLTITVTAAPASSTNSNSGGGGGSGTSSGYTCRLDWKCTEWSECKEEEQTRSCVLVDITPFRSLSSCPQKTIPIQMRSCKTDIEIIESCTDGIKNQNEEGIDCGGDCPSCKIEEETNEDPIVLESRKTENQNQITGAVIGGANKTQWIIAAVMVLLSLGAFGYAKLLKKPRNLTQEEVNRILRESESSTSSFDQKK